MLNGRMLKVAALAESASKAEERAAFGRPLNDADLKYMLGSGLKEALYRAENCMGWVWRKWLAGASREEISQRVGPFVERGLEYRELCRCYDYVALHDLYLLHCAIFGGSESQVRQVAAVMGDASGDKGAVPRDDGELYAAAWSGMLKYWILGEEGKAVEQSEMIWGAYRERGIFAAAKPLVTPWLKRDWPRFQKAQRKDFDKLWQRAKKDGWTVRAENSTQVIVTTEKYQIEHMWCWAHCGLGILGHRAGAEVATDEFWFPENAICDAKEKAKQHAEAAKVNQLEMF